MLSRFAPLGRGFIVFEGSADAPLELPNAEADFERIDRTGAEATRRARLSRRGERRDGAGA